MTLDQIFSIFSNIATILGVPIALIVFLFEKKKERRDREYGTYISLDDKYIEYLKMCMEHPELDLYDIRNVQETELTGDMKIRQYAMFDILVSLLERAYLLYNDQSNEIKRSQWAGWNEYCEAYSKNLTFRRLWLERGIQYERNFTQYINRLVGAASEKKDAVL